MREEEAGPGHGAGGPTCTGRQGVPASVAIRFLDAPADFVEVERAQQSIWVGSDLEVVPTHLLATAAHNGGFLAGAFLRGQGGLDPGGEQGAAEGSRPPGEVLPGRPTAPRLVGFVFGFLGIEENGPHGRQLKHCSHLLGVLPEFRDRGIGFLLKRAQREFVLGQGIDLITWTFDPLESRNAHLNLTRLGAIARRYRREVYGSMRDDLNRGMPSDRFEVEWWIRSERVSRRLPDSPLPEEEHAPCVNLTRLVDGDLRPVSWQLPTRGDWVAVEVPAQFRRMTQENRSLALQWRLHLREIFEALFAEGWVAEELWDRPREDRARARYLLRKAPEP